MAQFCLKGDLYQKNDFWKIFTKVLLGYGCGASMKWLSICEQEWALNQFLRISNIWIFSPVLSQPVKSLGEGRTVMITRLRNKIINVNFVVVVVLWDITVLPLWDCIKMHMINSYYYWVIFFIILEVTLLTQKIPEMC